MNWLKKREKKNSKNNSNMLSSKGGDARSDSSLLLRSIKTICNSRQAEQLQSIGCFYFILFYFFSDCIIHFRWFKNWFQLWSFEWPHNADMTNTGYDIRIQLVISHYWLKLELERAFRFSIWFSKLIRSHITYYICKSMADILNRKWKYVTKRKTNKWFFKSNFNVIWKQKKKNQNDKIL